MGFTVVPEIVHNYAESFGSLPGGEVRFEPPHGDVPLNDLQLIVDLPLIDRFLKFERGTQLIYKSEGSEEFKQMMGDLLSVTNRVNGILESAIKADEHWLLSNFTKMIKK